MAVIQPHEHAGALIDAATAAYALGSDGDVEIEPYVVVSIRVPMSVAVEMSRLSAGDLDSYQVEPFCRICGCTSGNACEGGCSWVEPDLCSACVSRVPILLRVSRVEAAP